MGSLCSMVQWGSKRVLPVSNLCVAEGCKINEQCLTTDSHWKLSVGWRDNVGGWFYPCCCLPHPNNDAACDRNEALSPPFVAEGNDANMASIDSSASVPHDGSAFNDNVPHCRYLKVIVQRSLEVHFESDGYRLRRHLLSLHDRVMKEDIHRSPGRGRRLDFTAENLRRVTSELLERPHINSYVNVRLTKGHLTSRPSLLMEWIQHNEKIKRRRSGTRNGRRVQFVVRYGRMRRDLEPEKLS